MGNTGAMPPRTDWHTAIAREARAAPELAAFALTAGPLLMGLPRGDGHPVLVLPGLGGADTSTAPLRWFLGQLGYNTFGWGLGENVGFGRHVTDGLDELLAAKRERGPVSVVGWSLGGLHAVDLAHRRPDAVRSLITLGSPLVGHRRPPATIRRHRSVAHLDAARRGPPRERRSAWQPSRLGPQSRRHRRGR